MRLIGPGPPHNLHKRIQNRKSLHGLMDYIDCIIKLPLNITQCFP